jgi:hypothetical protein
MSFSVTYGIAVAAAMADAWAGGESTSRMAEWATQEAEPVSIADIGHRLEKLGPGSSAIIGCDCDHQELAVTP